MKSWGISKVVFFFFCHLGTTNVPKVSEIQMGDFALQGLADLDLLLLGGFFVLFIIKCMA